MKLKETIKNKFEGSTEELNACIESYDSTLREKKYEIAEVYTNKCVFDHLQYFVLRTALRIEICC